MAVRKIFRQWSAVSEDYLYLFKGGEIFLRLVKLEDGFELRNPIGDTVDCIKCKDLYEADAKAKEILERFFDDKVNIKA